MYTLYVWLNGRWVIGYETRDAAALARMDQWYSRRGLATQWMGW